MSVRFGGASALKAALLLTGATYISYAAGLVTSTLVARALGPSDYGRYAYIVWLWGTLVMVMNNGLTTSAIRFISESCGRSDMTAAQSLHRWFSNRQWVSIAIVSAAFLAALPFVLPAGWSGHPELFAAVAVLASITKARYLFDVSACKGYGQFGIEAWSVIALCLANVAAVVVLWALGRGLDDFLWLFVAISLAHPMVAWVQMRRAGIRTNRLAPASDLLERVRPHLYWTIVLAFVAAFSNKSAETFLLNRYAGAEAVGFFAIAAALTRGGVDLLSSGLTTILMPMMSHGFGSGGMERVNKIAADAIRCFHFLGLLLVGVGVLWAAPIVELMYGHGYTPVIFVLQVMIVVGGLSISSGAFGALLSTTDHQKVRAGFAIVSIVVSAGAALLLVPTHGLEGALWAHAGSSFVLMGVLGFGVVRAMKLSLPYGKLGRLTLAATIAGLLAGGLAWVWPGLLAKFIAGGVYAVLYVPLTFALRAWQASDLQLLEPIARRIPAVGRLLARLSGHRP